MGYRVRVKYGRGSLRVFELAKFRGRKEAETCAEILRAALRESLNDALIVTVIKVRKVKHACKK